METEDTLNPFQAPPSRTWVAIGLDLARPNLNPNQPPSLIVSLRAVRSDMMPVQVEAAIFTDKVRLLPNSTEIIKQVIGVMVHMVQQLETYRDCACEQDKPCNQHKPPTIQ